MRCAASSKKLRIFFETAPHLGETPTDRFSTICPHHTSSTAAKQRSPRSFLQKIRTVFAEMRSFFHNRCNLFGEALYKGTALQENKNRFTKITVLQSGLHTSPHHECNNGVKNKERQRAVCFFAALCHLRSMTNL